ncbi:hypothetical protein [Rhodopseudomonas pseudopalustris]|uniref:hypothetical protein n=1 Tax=Rhodopseudomonas pseudopalustris TaxID=1513892 RepID=UPI003F94FFBD
MRVTIAGAECGRVGSMTGAVGAAVASWADGLGIDAVTAGVVFGTMLREIGRGFGSGTFFGAAMASIANPLSPMLSASVAVEARSTDAKAVTGVMGRMSRNRGGPR